MIFGNVKVGQRFTVPHLQRYGIVFIKTPLRWSDGTNRLSFVGHYNSVAVGGGRWIWTDEEVAIPL